MEEPCVCVCVLGALLLRWVRLQELQSVSGILIPSKLPGGSDWNPTSNLIRFTITIPFLLHIPIFPILLCLDVMWSCFLCMLTLVYCLGITSFVWQTWWLTTSNCVQKGFDPTRDFFSTRAFQNVDGQNPKSTQLYEKVHRGKTMIVQNTISTQIDSKDMNNPVGTFVNQTAAVSEGKINPNIRVLQTAVF